MFAHDPRYCQQICLGEISFRTCTKETYILACFRTTPNVFVVFCKWSVCNGNAFDAFAYMQMQSDSMGCEKTYLIHTKYIRHAVMQFPDLCKLFDVAQWAQSEFLANYRANSISLTVCWFPVECVLLKYNNIFRLIFGTTNRVARMVIAESLLCEVCDLVWFDVREEK